ncbi:MAG TPA: 2-oxo acid dehydrogenase subunit E2 [Kribbella sp.]|nr:2-oxo acid dehydrogenase subunit E2 [Kribbella sp.]
MAVLRRLPRRDGRLAEGVPNSRAIMPYIMRRRTESTVYFEQTVDMSRAQEWLERWNAAGGPRAGMFSLVLHLVAQMLHARPRLNRFVARRRLYDRDGVYLSFGAKKQLTEDAPLQMVKRRFEPDESLAEMVRSLDEAVTFARSDQPSDVDKELKLLLSLPTPVLDVAVSLFHWLDARGALPGLLTRSDPMYSSAVISNLGSLKTDAAYHHLYEHGNCPLFLVVGRVRQTPVADDDGTVRIRPLLALRWTFDERIEDGLYAANSAEWLRQRLEDPFRYLGEPEKALIEPARQAGERSTDATG